MTDQENSVKALITKAATTDKSHEALHLSQAALNCANALCSLAHINKSKSTGPLPRGVGSES